ncbi:MAG: alpha/beta fold hydrolase [Planctomycetota bacterium]|jgi:pimeloyl-ACP methyl ester carboxylesterase
MAFRHGGSVLALAALVGCAGAEAVDPAPVSAEVSADVPRQASPRAAVLGYALEQDAGSEAYRLVKTEPRRKVILEGSLEACEQALVQRLLAKYGSGGPNLPLATLGARQFWGDVFWYAGWRIQENVVTGHHRLLDPDDVRRAWGSREACRAVFERERVKRGITQPSDHLVVLLHGLARSRATFEDMEERLVGAGYGVAGLSYPSTYRSLAEHADQLETVLDGVDGVSRVSFVTHSLGGLVARETLSRDSGWRGRIATGRLVMLAPPSRGSRLATELADFLPFEALAGPAGQELALEHARNIPLPTCSFGIIAAGSGDGDGYNPWLPGDDDGIVAVEETRLDGAADFLLVSGLHTFVMQDREVIEAVLHFLATGRFAP